MAEARLSAVSGEALTDAVADRRLAAMATEILSSGDSVPDRRLGALSADVLTSSVFPERRLNSITVEVLVPARLTFVGWGMPVNHPSWS